MRRGHPQTQLVCLPALESLLQINEGAALLGRVMAERSGAVLLGRRSAQIEHLALQSQSLCSDLQLQTSLCQANCHDKLQASPDLVGVLEAREAARSSSKARRTEGLRAASRSFSGDRKASISSSLTFSNISSAHHAQLCLWAATACCSGGNARQVIFVPPHICKGHVCAPPRSGFCSFQLCGLSCS